MGPEEDEEEDPKTLPWPLNLPEDEDEDEKGLLTFFMNPLTLSFMSPILCTCKKKKCTNKENQRLKELSFLVFFCDQNLRFGKIGFSDLKKLDYYFFIILGGC